jgi:putative transposase
MAQDKNTAKVDPMQAALVNDPEFFRHIVQEACQTLLETEMRAHLQAGPYERTKERCGYRNGYKPRTVKTRVGTLELLVPQNREGTFQTELFSRYQRSEKALLASLMTMYIQGVSTRKVTRITEQLCGTSFSKSHISDLTQGLDKEIRLWRSRQLDKACPYLIVDARYEKVRIDHQILSQGVLLITGISEDGYRELLTVQIAQSESEASWADVFRHLKARGLHGVRLVVSDDHTGLKRAIARHFQGAAWQRCQVHFCRNLLDCLPRKEREKIARQLTSLFQSPDRSFALSRASELIATYQDQYPRFCARLEEGIEDTLACYAFPTSHRRRLRTTNMLERFNQELKRRTRVVRIFPNQQSCLRLIASLCLEQNEEWMTGRRYLNMEPLYEQGHDIVSLAPEEAVAGVA